MLYVEHACMPPVQVEEAIVCLVRSLSVITEWIPRDGREGLSQSKWNETSVLDRARRSKLTNVIIARHATHTHTNGNIRSCRRRTNERIGQAKYFCMHASWFVHKSFSIGRNSCHKKISLVCLGDFFIFSSHMSPAQMEISKDLSPVFCDEPLNRIIFLARPVCARQTVYCNSSRVGACIIQK